MNRKIPDKILEIVGNQSSYSNNVGMSDSEVLIYPDYVLKIQAESEETKMRKILLHGGMDRFRFPVFRYITWKMEQRIR